MALSSKKNFEKRGGQSIRKGLRMRTREKKKKRREDDVRNETENDAEVTI